MITRRHFLSRCNSGLGAIALAQLAVQTGDRERAAELYRELAGAESAHPIITDNRDIYRRNFQSLTAADVAARDI